MRTVTKDHERTYLRSSRYGKRELLIILKILDSVGQAVDGRGDRQQCVDLSNFGVLVNSLHALLRAS